MEWPNWATPLRIVGSVLWLACLMGVALVGCERQPSPSLNAPTDTPFSFTPYPYLVFGAVEDSVLGARFAMPKGWERLAPNQIPSADSANGELIIAFQDSGSLATLLVFRRTYAQFKAEFDTLAAEYPPAQLRWAPHLLRLNTLPPRLTYQYSYFTNNAAFIRVFDAQANASRGIEFVFRIPVDYLAPQGEFEPWRIEIVSAIMASVEWGSSAGR